MALEIFEWFYTVEQDYAKISDLLDMEVGESKIFLSLDDENVNSACASHVEDREYPADIFFCNSRLTVKRTWDREWVIYFWWDDGFEFPIKNFEIHDPTSDHDFWYVVRSEADLEHPGWNIGWKGPMIPWEKVINLPPVYFLEENMENESPTEDSYFSEDLD